MKLETKHLAPYLPYNLKCEVLNSGQEKEIGEMIAVYNDGSACFGNIVESEKGFEYIKPVLKPKTFLHELQDEIYIRWGGGISKEAKGYWLKDFTDNLMYTAYSALKFDEIEFMAEYHIDIFGLINQGLAVAE